jgi:hypothetical protein
MFTNKSKLNYPKPRLLLLTKNYKVLQCLQHIQDIQRYTKDTKYTNVSETNKSQACPNSTYTIGLPSLATITQSTQGSKEVMPPQVGYSKLP